jgi:hypothetical protein
MVVTPVVLGIAIAMEIKDRIFAAYGDPPFPRWAEFAGGWAIVIILPIIAILLMRMKTRRAE